MLRGETHIHHPILTVSREYPYPNLPAASFPHRRLRLSYLQHLFLCNVGVLLLKRWPSSCVTLLVNKTNEKWEMCLIWVLKACGVKKET